MYRVLEKERARSLSTILSSRGREHLRPLQRLAPWRANLRAHALQRIDNKDIFASAARPKRRGRVWFSEPPASAWLKRAQAEYCLASASATLPISSYGIGLSRGNFRLPFEAK